MVQINLKIGLTFRILIWNLGAIGIIPKNLFERLFILNPSIQLRNKFLKAALKVIAYTNIKKVKVHR